MVSNEFCAHLIALSRGRHPPNKVVIVSRWQEDVNWTRTLPIPVIVYEHGDKSAMHSVEVNLGSEASAYLQYIIDHYECLPAWTLFLHGHGRTGPEAVGGRHHPTNASEVVALMDVDRIDRGFVAVSHIAANANGTYALSPAAQAFASVSLPAHKRHAMAFVPFEDLRSGWCTCELLVALLDREAFRQAAPHCVKTAEGVRQQQPSMCAGGRCKPAWSWPSAAEFWASARRIRARPRRFWELAMRHALTGRPRVRWDNPASKVTPVAYCFESLWHYLMGEPLVHYHPLYPFIEDYPRITGRTKVEMVRLTQRRQHAQHR